jgi:hypothetical protein
MFLRPFHQIQIIGKIMAQMNHPYECRRFDEMEDESYFKKSTVQAGFGDDNDTGPGGHGQACVCETRRNEMKKVPKKAG